MTTLTVTKQEVMWGWGRGRGTGYWGRGKINIDMLRNTGDNTGKYWLHINNNNPVTRPGEARLHYLELIINS